MSNSIFGEHFKRLREGKGLSQAEVGRRLGHVSNAYIRDIERGVFIPPIERLSPLARALGVPVSQLRDASLEARLQNLGMRDPGFVAMFKDYNHLSPKDKEAILKTYHRIKRSKDGPYH